MTAAPTDSMVDTMAAAEREVIQALERRNLTVLDGLSVLVGAMGSILAASGAPDAIADELGRRVATGIRHRVATIALIEAVPAGRA